MKLAWKFQGGDGLAQAVGDLGPDGIHQIIQASCQYEGSQAAPVATSALHRWREPYGAPLPAVTPGALCTTKTATPAPLPCNFQVTIDCSAPAVRLYAYRSLLPAASTCVDGAAVPGHASPQCKPDACVLGTARGRPEGHEGANYRSKGGDRHAASEGESRRRRMCSWAHQWRGRSRHGVTTAQHTVIPTGSSYHITAGPAGWEDDALGHAGSFPLPGLGRCASLPTCCSPVLLTGPCSRCFSPLLSAYSSHSSAYSVPLHHTLAGTSQRLSPARLGGLHRADVDAHRAGGGGILSHRVILMSREVECTSGCTRQSLRSSTRVPRSSTTSVYPVP